MDVQPRDEGTTLALLREDSATWVRLLWRDSPKVVSRTEVPLTGLPAGAFSAGLWRDEVVVAGSTELRALPLDGGAARIVASYPASVDETAFGLAVRGDGVLVAAVVRSSKAESLIAFLSPDGGVQTRATTLVGNKLAWTKGLACGALGVLVACQNDGTCTFETDDVDAGNASNVGGPAQVFPPSLVGVKLGRLLGRRDQVYAEARPMVGAPVPAEPSPELRSSMLSFQVDCDLGKSSLTASEVMEPGFCATGLLSDAWPTPGQPEAFVLPGRPPAVDHQQRLGQRRAGAGAVGAAAGVGLAVARGPGVARRGQRADVAPAVGAAPRGGAVPGHRGAGDGHRGVEGRAGGGAGAAPPAGAHPGHLR